MLAEEAAKNLFPSMSNEGAAHMLVALNGPPPHDVSILAGSEFRRMLAAAPAAAPKFGKFGFFDEDDDSDDDQGCFGHPAPLGSGPAPDDAATVLLPASDPDQTDEEMGYDKD